MGLFRRMMCDQSKNMQSIIDRQMELDAAIYLCYKTADKTSMYGKDIDKCIALCESYMDQIPLYMEAHKARGVGMPTELRGANRLAIIYEKRKEYEKAITVCETCLAYNCHHDGAPHGVEKRLERLKKKSRG